MSERENHPVSDELLLSYAAGDSLSSTDRARVEAHIALNESAALRLERYQLVAALRAGDDSVSPPAHVVRRVKKLFANRAAPPLAGRSPWRRWLEGLDQVVASLVFDSRSQPAVAGYRRGAGGQVTTVSFECDLAEVDLELTARVSSIEPRLNVIGQITRLSEQESTPAAEGTPVALIDGQAGEVVAESECDESGMFTLETPRGVFSIVVRFPKTVLIIPDVEFA